MSLPILSLAFLVVTVLKTTHVLPDNIRRASFAPVPVFSTRKVVKGALMVAYNIVVSLETSSTDPSVLEIQQKIPKLVKHAITVLLPTSASLDTIKLDSHAKEETFLIYKPVNCVMAV